MVRVRVRVRVRVWVRVRVRETTSFQTDMQVRTTIRTRAANHAWVYFLPSRRSYILEGQTSGSACESVYPQVNQKLMEYTAQERQPKKRVGSLTKIIEELEPMIASTLPRGNDIQEIMTVCLKEEFSNMKPLIIFEDNRACVAYSENPCKHSIMKHLDWSVNWIRQQVAQRN